MFDTLNRDQRQAARCLYRGCRNRWQVSPEAGLSDLVATRVGREAARQAVGQWVAGTLSVRLAAPVEARPEPATAENLPLDQVASDLVARLVASGMAASEAAIFGQRSVSARAEFRSYVEHGSGQYVTRCCQCDARIFHATWQDYRQAIGQACQACDPPASIPRLAAQNDQASVTRTRTRKGKTSVRVNRHSDWSVSGSTTAAPGLKQQVRLRQAGWQAADWRAAWQASFHQVSPGVKVDGSLSGSGLARVADLVLRMAPGFLAGDDGRQPAVPERIGAANALSWQAVLTMPPGAAIFARHRCGLAGYYDGDSLPDLTVARVEAWPRVVDGIGSDRLAASASGLLFSVERTTAATLADHATTAVSGLVRPTRYRLAQARVRKAERLPEWALPLCLFGHKVSLLHGPVTDDGRVFIGHELVTRGQHARPDTQAANEARQTVDGQRAGTLVAGRTLTEPGQPVPVDLPTMPEVWFILADELAPGDRLEWAAENMHGSLTRSAAGRFSASVYAGADIVRIAGQRSPGAIARMLAALAAT